MKQYALPVITSMLISACCSYDKKDFDFSSKEEKQFANYKVGDTLYFQSNLGDLDTITVVGFGTEINKNCGGFMAPPPVNGKWIEISHLPSDKWQGTSQEIGSGRGVEITYQPLFWISKQPAKKITSYSIHFKDFYTSNDTIIGEYHNDTLLLNNLRFSNYYIARHGYPERMHIPDYIETVYWTNEYGLTAYKSKNAEVWTKKLNPAAE